MCERGLGFFVSGFRGGAGAELGAAAVRHPDAGLVVAPGPSEQTRRVARRSQQHDARRRVRRALRPFTRLRCARDDDGSDLGGALGVGRGRRSLGGRRTLHRNRARYDNPREAGDCPRRTTDGNEAIRTIAATRRHRMPHTAHSMPGWRDAVRARQVVENRIGSSATLELCRRLRVSVIPEGLRSGGRVQRRFGASVRQSSRETPAGRFRHGGAGLARAVLR